MLKILSGIIGLVLIFSVVTIIYSDFSALGAGDPEVNRVIFIDKFKPAHLDPPGIPDGGSCDATSDNFSTIGGGISWKKFPVKYHINTNGINGVSENDAKNAVRNAFETWDNENHGGDNNGNFFKEINNRNQANIKVSWRTLDGPLGTVGMALITYSPTTKEITKVDIFFDKDEDWRVFSNLVCESQTGGFDIEDIAAHEIGHSIGLGHVTQLSEDEKNTMYSFIIYEGETHKRTLGVGDVMGIEALYPESSKGGDDGDSGPSCPPGKAAKGKC